MFVNRLNARLRLPLVLAKIDEDEARRIRDEQRKGEQRTTEEWRRESDEVQRADKVQD